MTDTFSLKVKGLRKKYNDSVVLNDVSAGFLDSSVNVIIGPSGIGKSVLLKCLLGLEKPDSGEVKFLKCLSNDITPRIGILFQKPVLYFEKTVYDNVKFNLDLYSREIKVEDSDKAIREALQQVGLLEHADEYPGNFSGGMQKRLGLAMAIVYEPQYLFCDEPDSGLDPEATASINKLIYDLTHAKGMTTVIITHNLDTVLTSSDYVVFLDKIKEKPLGNKDEGAKVFWHGPVADLINVKKKRLQTFLDSNILWREYKKNHEVKAD